MAETFSTGMTFTQLNNIDKANTKYIKHLDTGSVWQKVPFIIRRNLAKDNIEFVMEGFQQKDLDTNPSNLYKSAQFNNVPLGTINPSMKFGETSNTYQY